MNPAEALEFLKCSAKRGAPIEMSAEMVAAVVARVAAMEPVVEVAVKFVNGDLHPGRLANAVDAYLKCK